MFILGFIAFQSFCQTREIPLQGAYNFRDLGGYKTKDGKHIKWGKIYRSALLANLSSEDLQILEALKIGKVVDFRGPKEVAFAPDKMPHTAQYIELAAGSENDGPDDWEAMAKDMLTHSTQALDKEAVQYYKDITALPKRYTPFFEALLQLPKDSALVFHCVGGKDRTGIAAALVEYVLGVDSTQIVQDYLATNTYREHYNASIASLLHLRYGVPLNKAKTYGLAKAEYLNTTFSEIKKQYGSLDKFVKEVLGLDENKIRRLRELYVE